MIQKKKKVLRTLELPRLVLQGGRIIDSACERDQVANLCLVNDHVVSQPPPDTAVIDATGLIVCPGLMDIHVHLRQPGQTHKETIESGTAAAAAGGFTAVACMPNTQPPLDSPERIREVLELAKNQGQCKLAKNESRCRVMPIAAITKGREGREITDFAALLKAGAVAFSDDGAGVEDDVVMRAAFEKAQETGALLIQHCEYKELSAGGVMHLGKVSKRLGFPGLDPKSEEAMIERDIDLCRQIRARYHVAHISTARSIELVRRAKAEGMPVTAEVCPHHLLLTDEACKDADPNTKMHPPLRPQSDVTACRQGLLDGTIDCIATDHAPHAATEKVVGFLKAPPGIVGLETAVGLSALAMIESGLAHWPRLVCWMTTGPASILNLPEPTLAVGAPGYVTLIDPERRWTVAPDQFLSRSRNTPFDGWSLTGKPVATYTGNTLRTTENLPIK